MYRLLAASILALTLTVPLSGVSKKYVVEQVESSGLGDLPQNEAAQIRALLIGKTYDPEQPGQLLEQAREALLDLGYFKAWVEKPSILPLRTDQDPSPILLSFVLEAGARYHAGKIEVLGVNAATAAELQNLIPLQTGAILEVSRIRLGLKAIQGWYASRGFINEVTEPNQEIDTYNKIVSVTLVVDPGGVFHVGTIEVLGIDDASSAQLLRLVPLQTGAIFDPDKICQAIEAMKCWLASHGSPNAAVDSKWKIDQDNKIVSVKLIVNADPKSRP